MNCAARAAAQANSMNCEVQGTEAWAHSGIFTRHVPDFSRFPNSRFPIPNSWIFRESAVQDQLRTREFGSRDFGTNSGVGNSGVGNSGNFRDSGIRESGIRDNSGVGNSGIGNFKISPGNMSELLRYLCYARAFQWHLSRLSRYFYLKFIVSCYSGKA